MKRFAPRWATVGGLCAVFCLATLSADAVIPSSAKIARALAKANGASARGKPLLIDVELQVNGGGVLAEGDLAVHPSGLARLELRNRQGFTERHLLQGSTYRASRDGEPLDNPHRFLPPIFLLQARSGEGLAAALASFGIDAGRVELGKLGTHDCYVFGGRKVGAGRHEMETPSFWVDLKSFDPLRIVSADGVEYRFGPIEVFGRVRLPKWIELRTTGGLRARLQVLSATPAEAPAALFQPRWLSSLSAE